MIEEETTMMMMRFFCGPYWHVEGEGVTKGRLEAYRAEIDRAIRGITDRFFPAGEKRSAFGSWRPEEVRSSVRDFFETNAYKEWASGAVIEHWLPSEALEKAHKKSLAGQFERAFQGDKTVDAVTKRRERLAKKYYALIAQPWTHFAMRSILETSVRWYDCSDALLVYDPDGLAAAYGQWRWNRGGRGCSPLFRCIRQHQHVEGCASSVVDRPERFNLMMERIVQISDQFIREGAQYALDQLDTAAGARYNVLSRDGIG